MLFCEEDHEQVCYESNGCPVCRVASMMQEQIRELENTIEERDNEIDELSSEVEELTEEMGSLKVKENERG